MVQRRVQAARFGPPHLGRTANTGAAGDDPSAVGAERHAADLPGVSLKFVKFFARQRVPHLGRVVVATGNDACAQGAERHTGYFGGVPLHKQESSSRTDRKFPLRSSCHLLDRS